MGEVRSGWVGSGWAGYIGEKLELGKWWKWEQEEWRWWKGYTWRESGGDGG